MPVKDAASLAAKRGKDAVIARWRAFREESPYFQAKVGLVAAWAVVALLTIFIAPPTPVPFIVEQKSVSFGLSQKTTVTIFNQNAGNLDEAIIEVSGAIIDYDGKEAGGSWRTKPTKLPEGIKTTLATEAFFDRRGVNPGYNLRVNLVRILDDGDVLYEGPAVAPPR